MNSTPSAEDVKVLRELWQLFFIQCPVDSQFFRWLIEHPLERMVYAVTRTGVKFAQRTLNRSELWYCIKTTTKFADEQEREDRARSGALSVPLQEEQKRPMAWHDYNWDMQWRFEVSKAAEERE
ncbi:MAG TPA: hypothetical protein VHA06_22355 [Candidatus Angelobacter sp.]|jgi:hypothetical protein|nr:hypothetical protein [Candidatus Angelobacter sp.]